MCEREFGAELRSTIDHVVPRGFFGPTPPPNLPTWRICRPCNGELDPREDRLRNLFASAHSRHPEEVAGVMAKASRATRQPQPVARRHVRTDAGLQVPVSVAVPDQSDLDRVFQKVARGLFWWRNHELPTDPRWAVRLMSASDFDRWTHLIRQGREVQRLGPEFWWLTAIDEGDLTGCIWLFVIFGAIPIGVWHGSGVECPLPAPAGIPMREEALDRNR
jgi:hypothetical protein